MAPRKTKGSNDGDGGGHRIGYGRPPKHTQFRPGHSGNPAGRRKGVRNLVTDFKRTLRIPVRVKEDGRTRIRSTQEGALMVLREKALHGDARALDRFLELALRFNSAPTRSKPPKRSTPTTGPFSTPMWRSHKRCSDPDDHSVRCPPALKSTTAADKHKRSK